MADNVVIYYVAYKGTLYEVNLLTGTYWGVPSMDRLEARQRALTWAGIPFKSWDKGEPSSMYGEFGVEIKPPEPTKYDAIIYEDQSGLWWSEAGVSTAIPDPTTLDGMVHVATAAGKKILTWPGGDVNLPGAFGARAGKIPGPG